MCFKLFGCPSKKVNTLKGQCHEIFTPHFFSWIDYTWAPYAQAKTVQKMRVRVLQYYADTIFFLGSTLILT